MDSSYFQTVLYGTLAVFLLVIQDRMQASAAYASCLDQTYKSGIAFCDSLLIQEPPAGYWPEITHLDLSWNNISRLWADSFDGFPNLEFLSLSSNPLEEIDLRIFVRLKKLGSLYLQNCQIKRIIPLEHRQTMPNLERLYLDDNTLTRVPMNLLNGLTNKTLILGLSGNPLEFPKNTPILSSENLNILDLCHLNANGISAETFEALPKLETLVVGNSSLTDISYKFTHLPTLRYLILSYNPFSEIKRGFLSPEQRLNAIDVSHSQLQTIEDAAVEGKTENAVLIFDDTPMACQCDYENMLYYFDKLEGKCTTTTSPCYLNLK